eukprot:TRINITY_DN1911_c0_g1_i2.p1 TRINITY_DN1911_c0_g1~~TRINITY_DN1911_c0_g1_i2.p1  ORF type:complete len:400 (+),score=111.99 TRINITY_DN1911_c0_g1_i2:160-1359(+)
MEILPSEMILYVTNYLNDDNLRSLLRVCKRFYSIIIEKIHRDEYFSLQFCAETSMEVWNHLTNHPNRAFMVKSIEIVRDSLENKLPNAFKREMQEKRASKLSENDSLMEPPIKRRKNRSNGQIAEEAFSLLGSLNRLVWNGVYVNENMWESLACSGADLREIRITHNTSNKNWVGNSSFLKLIKPCLKVLEIEIETDDLVLDFEEFFKVIIHCKQLKRLCLYESKHSSVSISPVIEGLGGMERCVFPDLEQFRFSFSNLQSNSSPVIQFLEQNPSIVDLYLSQFCLSGINPSSLPKLETVRLNSDANLEIILRPIDGTPRPIKELICPIKNLSDNLVQLLKSSQLVKFTSSGTDVSPRLLTSLPNSLVEMKQFSIEIIMMMSLIPELTRAFQADPTPSL